jgi:hypothetical protein
MQKKCVETLVSSTMDSTSSILLTLPVFTLIVNIYYFIVDRLCGLVVTVLGYRFGGPGSIPGTTRFSEEKKRKQ